MRAPIFSTISAKKLSALENWFVQKFTKAKKERPAFPSNISPLFGSALEKILESSAAVPKASILAKASFPLLKMVYTEPFGLYEETGMSQLRSIMLDISVSLDKKLSKNCRNIADEVFQGVMVGDM